MFLLHFTCFTKCFTYSRKRPKLNNNYFWSSLVKFLLEHDQYENTFLRLKIHTGRTKRPVAFTAHRMFLVTSCSALATDDTQRFLLDDIIFKRHAHKMYHSRHSYKFDEVQTCVYLAMSQRFRSNGQQPPCSIQILC